MVSPDTFTVRFDRTTFADVPSFPVKVAMMSSSLTAPMAQSASVTVGVAN